MGISDFFTPEAGQRRTQWLYGVGDQIGETADYYLGPTGIPERVGALAQIAGMFSPGADVVDANDASGRLMRSRTPLEAATSAADLTATIGSMFVPGNVSTLTRLR